MSKKRRIEKIKKRSEVAISKIAATNYSGVGGTYSSNSRKLNARWITPRYLNCSIDPYSYLNVSERIEINRLALDLFRSSPLIHAAITRKNEWVAATEWLPMFKGVDKEWGKLAYDYLVNEAYATCNVAGPNYSWNRTLQAIANQLDISGDTLAVFVPYDTGTRIAIYPSSLVGQRNASTEVVGGRYDGNEIDMGIIFSRAGYPVAYNILQQDENEDFIFNITQAQLYFEPNELCRRGISTLAAPLLSFLDIQDIQGYLNRLVKNTSKLPITVNTEAGTGEEFALGGPGENIPLSITDSTSVSTPNIVDFGDYTFFKAGIGEKFDITKNDNPSLNNMEWLRHVSEECCSALGWPLALLHPSQLAGSAAAKSIEAQVQQTITVRQQTLKMFVKQFTAMTLSRAIASGRLPQPKTATDWRAWEWSMPAEFVMDSYYADQSDLSGLKAGTKSLQEVISRNGNNWEDINEQRIIENKARLDHAKQLVAYSGGSLTFERALDMAGNAGLINAAPIQEQLTPKEI